MSINLRAISHGSEIMLWQTPTHVTYSLVSAGDGYSAGEATKVIMEKYFEWVRSNPNKRAVNDHISYVKECIERGGVKIWAQ